MANQYQSIDPTLVAINAAKKVTPQAKKTPVPSLTTQAPIQPSLNLQTQQPQAISANITPPVAKIGGISSPFGATNINSSPVLGGATPNQIQERATQLQSLPKQIPASGAAKKIDVNVIGSLGANVMAGEDLPTIRSKYPEFSNIDDEVLGSVLATMYDGVGPEEILQKFPELQGGQKDNFITNLGSGIAGTAAATGQLGKNLAFKAVDLYRTKVQGKEKLTPEQRAMAEQSDMGQNLSSITNRQTEAQKKSIGGQIGTAVGTLGQAFAMPTGVGSLSKIPAVAKIAQKAPIISSMIKGGLQGVVGQDQYTLMTEGRQSTAEERSIAGGIGLAFPLLGAIIKATKPFVQKGIKSAVNTLQTSGIINPAKFDQIKSQLIAEGVEGMEKATVDDVANFLTERGIKGTRQQQADILEEVANKSRLAKKEVLDLSTNLHAPDSAKVLAQTLVDELGTAKSQATKAIASKAQQLLNKLDNGGATLNEIDDLRAMGRKELNTRTSAGNVKISQQDVDNLIGEVRGYIEDAAQKEGLPQLVGYQGEKNLIKMLNNQTSTAKGLAEGILRRDSTDAVQQLMTFMSARGGGVIAGGLAGSQGGMFDNNTTAGKIGNIAVGAFLGGIVDNPKIKSNVAQYLNKLTGTQKGAILKRMESGGKELLEREDKNVINGLKNIIMNNNKKIPNSLPFKQNANIAINDITTSAMGNSNKAGVILSEGGIVAPKPTPKTPPITVEKGAIGMGTPKVNNTPVIPPKATVAPSVGAPKVISKQIDDIISEYGKITYKGEGDKIKKLSPNVESKLLDIPGVKQYFESNGIKDRNGLINFLEKRHKVIREPIEITKKADMAQASKDRFTNGMNKALENAGIKARLPISKANTPVAPKKGMPKLGKEIMEQDIGKIPEGSVVTNTKGKPLIVYHGTSKGGFDDFKSGYFTEDKGIAKIYESSSASSIGKSSSFYNTPDSPAIYEVQLDIKKPFDTRDKKIRDLFYKEYQGKYSLSNADLSKRGLPDWTEGEYIRDWIEETNQPFDGIIVDEGGLGGYGEKVLDRGISYAPMDYKKQVKILNKNINNKKPLPAKGLPKLPKGEVLEQNLQTADNELLQEAKKYKSRQDMDNQMPYTIRNKLSDQGIYSRKHIEDFYNLAKSEKTMYRGQTAKGKDISYNNTKFVGDTDGGVFFSPDKQDASKYGSNIIELKSNRGNTVSIAESNKLQKMAQEKVALALKNNTKVSDIIEQMALGRPKSFAKYTGKQFIETGDKFGQKGEMIYYKDIK